MLFIFAPVRDNFFPLFTVNALATSKEEAASMGISSFDSHILNLDKGMHHTHYLHISFKRQQTFDEA